MSSRRGSIARYRQSPTDREYLRKSPAAHATLPLSEPGIVRMQHTMGNQAVQRLLQREMQPDTPAVVQRAPGDTTDGERPGALATLVLSNKGKLRGSSRIAGHEGKIELLSLALNNVQKPNSRESETEEQRIEIVISKYVDDISPLLTEAFLKGDGVKSAQFELIHSDAEGKVEVYHTLDFSDGLITSYSAGGTDNHGKALESFSIEFRMKPKK